MFVPRNKIFFNREGFCRYPSKQNATHGQCWTLPHDTISHHQCRGRPAAPSAERGSEPACIERWHHVLCLRGREGDLLVRPGGDAADAIDDRESVPTRGGAPPGSDGSEGGSVRDSTNRLRVCDSCHRILAITIGIGRSSIQGRHFSVLLRVSTITLLLLSRIGAERLLGTNLLHKREHRMACAC